jgi:hypothetical protein
VARQLTSAVDGVVHGSEWCWKNDDLQVRPQNSRITRESPLSAPSARRRVLKHFSVKADGFRTQVVNAVDVERKTLCGQCKQMRINRCKQVGYSKQASMSN